MSFGLLVFFAFVAGLVDAVAGGGGLIQLPALLVFLPPGMAANLPAVLGTNKLSSICGTSVAAFQYATQVKSEPRVLAPAIIGALICSYLGARAVTFLDPALVQPAIACLLVGVALFTYLRRDVGAYRRFRIAEILEPWAAGLLGSVIGFYDGFLGPGTGTFLIFGLVTFFGMEFLQASASAKIINVATNLAAVIWFIGSGNVFYEYALPMAAANIAGAAVGSRLAILKGNQFIRKFFLGVVLLLIGRYAWEVLVVGSQR